MVGTLLGDGWDNVWLWSVQFWVMDGDRHDRVGGDLEESIRGQRHGDQQTKHPIHRLSIWTVKWPRKRAG